MVFEDNKLDALLARAGQLSAQIRQILSKQRGWAPGARAISDEAQELIDNWSAAELRGESPSATTKLSKLLQEHHCVSEQILKLFKSIQR